MPTSAASTPNLTPSGPPSGMSITTPGNWVRIDVSSLADNGLIASLVDQQLKDRQIPGSDRETLVRTLQEAILALKDVSVDFAAATVEREGDRVLIASATVILAPVEGAELESLADQYHFRPAAPEKTEVVELQAGRALRIEAVEAAQIADGASIVTLSVQYLLPVPNTGLMAALNFNTPTVGYRGPLTELFDTMAQSFRFEWPDGAAN